VELVVFLALKGSLIARRAKRKARRYYEELVFKKKAEPLVQLGAPSNGNGNGHKVEETEKVPV
jgi:hypothetical protein